MNNYRWIPFVVAVVLAAIVGVMAYNAGLAHGIAQSGKIAVPPAGPYPYPYYGWHPWGGGFFFGPILFFLFFFLLIRGLFWGAWHRGGCRGHYLNEWHRHAHERFNEQHDGGATQR